MKKTILGGACLLLSACDASHSQPTLINGVALDYIVTGDGPPLYLLHGGMESRESFKHQIPEFSKSFTVVAVDSREQGRSERVDTQISYELMSQDVVALAAHLGHDKISIIGSSDGGVTALTTAFNHPDLIDKLVVLGANYHVSAYSDDMRAFITNFKWDGNTDPEKYPGIFIEHYLTGHDNLDKFEDLLTEMSAMWMSSPTYSTADISTIKAPTLVINGDHDDMDMEHTRSLYEALPNAELYIVPDGDHYALSKKPELINEVALEFLLAD